MKHPMFTRALSRVRLKGIFTSRRAGPLLTEQFFQLIAEIKSLIEHIASTVFMASGRLLCFKHK